MRPVSPEFLTTITGSHTMCARARVCTTFQTDVEPVGTVIPILDGAVSLDGTAAIRSSVDLATDGTGMWPTGRDSLLVPYGNEIFIERGVQYSASSIEWCSLGYFRIQTPSQDNPPNGPIRITGQDRMAGIIDARMLNPIQFSANATYGQVMSLLVLDVYPLATVVWDDATEHEPLGRSLIVEDDRHKFLDDLVQSRGKVWYWDYRGILVIENPASATNPVFNVRAGEGGVLIKVSRQITREGVYNAVVASGEASDAAEPVRAFACDINPASPTFIFGPFGKVPRYFSSAFITTTAEAAAAAEAMVRTQLGLPYNVDFEAVPNPALEPFDPIRIRFANGQSDEIHVIETLSVPLVAEATMSGATREQTTVLIGAP